MTPGHTLVIGIGNPGRLDDGLGPAFAERIEHEALPGVDVLTEYQLNIEHAADIAARGNILFADAAAGPGPCFLRRLLPRHAAAFSTHAMAPEAVLALARDTLGWQGRAYLLGLRGSVFDGFGEGLSTSALANLAAATALLLAPLRAGCGLDDIVTDEPTADSHTLRNGGVPCKTASP